MTMAFEGPIALNLRLVVKPEHKAAMLESLKTGQENTYKETGSLQFTFGQDVDNPNVLHVHEQYKTRDDLSFHEDTPYCKEAYEWIEEAQPLAEDMVYQKYTCTHDAEEKSPPRKGAYCLNVECRLRPSCRESYIALMTTHQQKSRSEPHCLQFDWGQSANDPNVMHIHEEYSEKAGYLEHEESPHFHKFMKYIEDEDPFVEPNVVSFFTTIA